ncbi:MAG: chromosome segregation protein SMC [Calditrichaceae bacterium]
MYLSKLEIIGFKSFANKIKLNFADGVSCIIGPNGSGKSNIVDAVRWVLGEQRVTSLRSDRMENVLFNGTKLRKPIGMAEVSMTIQNNKNILKTEFDEVLVSRRLYRSGESQYLINKSPVRLKDILDLFVDTGMGANSYSVIELKMVESILSESTQERRQLFEEAAGIVKYKIRRKSALRKLDATHVDLNRLNDIIAEITKTVNSLSRQVGKARRYLSYSDQVQKTEINLYRYRYHKLIEAIRPLKIQLQEASKLKESSHHQITMDEALLEDYKRELVKTEQKLQTTNIQIHEIDSKIADINQNEAVGETKAEEIKKTRERYKLEIEEFSRKILILDENLTQYNTELEKLKSQKEIYDTSLIEIEKKRSAEAAKLQNRKAEIDKMNQDFRLSLQALSEKKESLKQQEYQLQFYTEQLEQLGGNINSFEESLKILGQQLDKLSEEKDKITKVQEKLIDDLKNNEIELAEFETSKKERENEYSRLLTEIDRIQSRKHFFEQVIAHYEGHSKSAQFALTNKDKIPGVYGSLSDIISIENKYAWSVESVLGDALNYILVKDINTAKQLINLVKDNKKGRITLIPLEQINESKLNAINQNGDIELLSELVKCDSKYKNLIHILLGDVALVENFDEAIIKSNKYPNLRFVTTDGEMVNFNREISGGSIDKKGTTIIGRKDQLKKLEKELDHLNKDVNKIKDDISSIDEKIASLVISKNDMIISIEDKKQQLIDLDKKESQYKYQVEKEDQDQKGEKDRVNTYKNNIVELKKNIELVNVNVEKNQLELDKKEAETIENTNDYEKLNESLQLILNEVQNAQLSVTNIQNQISNRQNDIQRTENSKSEMDKSIKSRKAEIVQITELLEQIKKDSDKRKIERETIWENRDKLESEVEKITQETDAIKQKITEVENQTRQYRKQHDTSLEKSRALELQISENNLKAANLRDYILKEYSEDIEIGIPFEDLNEQESEDTIESLRVRIKNLGPVNPLAVSEYEKEKERLDFLTNQRDDLYKAEASLKETIKKINKTARQQFLETFDSIKKNFEHVFRSFFENGEGTLKLQEEVDPLEADVEINVRTKGKKLQTLSLLSGGEKTLTAISLLFSIYLVKPSPFCILDEVDAPLDDVNIGRFTDALKSFAKNTQFIVVTHNKRTMEAAQTMYGVTMEEEGVSKIVSVKFT